MKKRSYLARVKAMFTSTATPLPVEGESSDTTKIAMINPDTGKIVKVFDSVSHAVFNGYSAPNIGKALKSNGKYKGHLWVNL